MGRVKNTASLKRKNLGWKWWCNLMFSVFPIFLPLHMWGKKKRTVFNFYLFIYFITEVDCSKGRKESKPVFQPGF